MSLKTSNYGAARGILGFAELILWCGIGLGVIVAIVAAGAAARGFGSSGLLAAVPGIFISVLCFLGVVIVQMAKATVDSADYSYQMLSVARDQLAVSKQGLSKASAPQGYASGAPKGAAPEQSKMSAGQQMLATQSRNEPTPVPPRDTPLTKQDWDYRGLRINRTVHGYLVEGQTFETLELAKLHVDGEALRAGLHRPSGASS